MPAPANRGERVKMKTACMSFIVILVQCLASAEVVETQAENDAGHRAAAAARRQFERDLTSSDPSVRWNAIRAVSSLDDPWLAELVVPLCQSQDLWERVLALEVVANTNPRLGKAEFIDALNSHERAVRLRALLGLAALGDRDTASDIVEILKDDPDPDLRVVAAKTLGSIGDLRAAPALYKAIEDLLPALGEEAVRALLAMNDPDVAEFLGDRLENGGDPAPIPLLRMIALVPDRSVIEILVPYVESDDSMTRSFAAAAILSVLELTGNRPPDG